MAQTKARSFLFIRDETECGLSATSAARVRLLCLLKLNPVQRFHHHSARHAAAAHHTLQPSTQTQHPHKKPHSFSVSAAFSSKTKLRFGNEFSCPGICSPTATLMLDNEEQNKVKSEIQAQSNDALPLRRLSSFLTGPMSKI